MEANDEGKLYYGLGLDNSLLRADADRASEILKGIGDSAEAEGSRIDNAYNKIANAVGGYFTLDFAKSFIADIVRVRGEIESLSISFETLLGSKTKADALFGQIKDFATKTPLELTPLAKGAQTLLSFNVEAEKVMPILQQIGDISMGSADKFNSLVLSFSQMSATGKLMGQDLLQMINAGFNPLSVISEKTGKSISQLKDEMSAGSITSQMVADAFASATAAGGMFYGMLEKQSDGIEGSISNLQGAIDDMLNDLGTKGQGLITSSISGAALIVENYEKVGTVIMDIVVAYGSYKAALIALNIVQSLNRKILMQAVLEKRLAAAAGIQLSNAEAVAAARTKMLTLAQQGLVKALNAAKEAMLNPYTLAAVAVAALVYGLYKLITHQTDAEKAQQKLNETVKEFNIKTSSEQAEIDRLFDKLKNTSKESSNYKKVKDEIISKYGSYLEGLREEIKSLNDVEAAYRAISVAAKQAAIDRAVANATKDAQDSYAERVQKINDNLHKSLLGKMSPGAAEAFLETINMELEKTGKLSDTTKEKLEQFNVTIRNYQSGASYELNDTKVWIEKMIENKAQLEQAYKNIQKKLGISVNEYENLAKEQVDTYIAAFEKAIIKRSQTGNKQVIELSGKWVTFESEEELNLHLTKLKNVKEQLENGESIGEQVSSKNKAYWEEVKKNAESALEAIDSQKKKLLDAGKFEGIDPDIVETYKEQSKRLKEATKELNVYDSNSKQDNEASKLREQQERYRVLIEKQKLDRIRTEEDLQMQVDQARIDSLGEGSAKYIDQMNLNLKKESQAIDRRKEDYLRKKIDDARAAFEADPKNKDKTFDATGIALSDKELKLFDNQYKYVLNKQDQLNKEMALKYQNYADQRLAIEKKYNDDIAILVHQRTLAERNGNKELADQLSRSIAQATKDKGKELISFDFNILKQSPEYVRAFEDLKNTSSETLNALLEQLDSMKGKASEVLDPTELREYTSTIQDIINELTERDPFKALSNSQLELSKAGKELAAAEKTLLQVKNGARIITKLETDQNGKIVAAFLSEEEAIDNVNKAKDKYIKSSNNVVKAQKTVNEKMDELYSALSGVGNALGGTAGEIIGLIADIGLFVNTSIEGMKTASNAASTSLQAIERASVILAIISVAIQLMQKLNELFPSAHDAYLEFADKIAQINKLSDAVSDYEIAVIKARKAEGEWFAENNLKSLREAKELNDAVKDAYITKLYESQAIYQNEGGGGWLTDFAHYTNPATWIKETGISDALSNAFGFMGSALFGLEGTLGQAGISLIDSASDMPKYVEGQTAAINNLRIETRKAKSGFLGSGIGGKSQKTEDLQTWINQNKDKFKGLDTQLFDKEGLINKELAKSILDNYGDKLVGQTKETIETLIELREQYDEYLEQLHEYVSSLYEPLVDNFVDSLWDWFDNGTDALDSFKSHASDTFRDIVSDMMRTIILQNVVKGFSDDISELYQKYSSGEMSEIELMEAISKRTAGLISDYEKNTPMLQEVMESITGSISNIAGIDLANPSDSSREASSKGFASMSQDSADELNGRFTAVQAHTFELNENLKPIVSFSKQAYEASLEIRSAMDSLKTNSSEILIRLTGIEANTKHCSRLESIENDMKAVKDGINDINLKGITIKK
jgi:tape measure domain-containing protein